MIEVHQVVKKMSLPLNGAQINKIAKEDIAVHDWYRFVLSYPPHLVKEYLTKFGVTDKQLVLDPFCGTGTTLVECKKLGVPSVGIEAHPFTYFAAKVKVDWDIDQNQLLTHATFISRKTREILLSEGIHDDELLLSQNSESVHNIQLNTLDDDLNKLLLKDSISPLPLHKVLVLLDVLKENKDNALYEHELLALAKALVYKISNLHFGPEVGLGKIKEDCSVTGEWMVAIKSMVKGITEIKSIADAASIVMHNDSRNLQKILAPESVDAVITSPPYPNEKDYTRTTRLESVLLGFINSKEQLQGYKKTLVRSNTRSVYKADDDDDWIKHFPEIIEIANAIEKRRIELGKTSGFERMYPRVTKLYFGGMARHLESLRHILKKNAKLAYVVGDQASYLRVMIRTGSLLAQIAEHLGYEVIGIDLFRTRIATATKEQLREEVVLLNWKG